MKSSEEDTWKFQYDCSGITKYRQKCPRWTRRGAFLLHGSYRVSFTDEVMSELSLEGELGFCQGEERGEDIPCRRKNIYSHSGLEWRRWFRQGGKSDEMQPKGLWVGSQEAGEGVWVPQRLFWSSSADALTPSSLPALDSFVLCQYCQQRAAKERRPAACLLCFQRVCFQ